MYRMIVVALGLVLTACGHATGQTAQPAQPSDMAARQARRATALIESRSDSTARGSAVFVSDGGKITLKVSVEGASSGTHAMHVHDVGDCSAKDASSAGGHFNPTGEDHGRWGHPPHHLGDIGNIEVGADGTGVLVLTTDRWSIGTGKPNDIVGRSLILHAGVDDFQTQPTGNAGGRIGCGVIRAD